MYLKQSDWRKFQGEVSLQNNTLKYQDFILRKKFYLQRSLIILHLCGIENSLRNEACKVNKLFFQQPGAQSVRNTFCLSTVNWRPLCPWEWQGKSWEIPVVAQVLPPTLKPVF